MDFNKIGEVLERKLVSVLNNSHVLAKYLFLSGAVIFAFLLRVVGFIRVRGVNEFEDVFNMALSDKLSSTGVANYLHDPTNSENVIFPGLNVLAHCGQLGLSYVGVTLPLQTLLTVSGPFFATAATASTFLLGAEIKDATTGIVAAFALSLFPGFFAISVDGRNANVVGGTWMLVMVLLFLVRAVKRDSPLNALLAGIAFFGMSALWNGYVFVLILIPTYVAVLIALNKCSHSVYTAYSLFFVVYSLLNILLPVGGLTGILRLENFFGLGIFVLLQLTHKLNMANLAKPFAGLLAILFVGGAVLGLLSPSQGAVSFWSSFTSGKGSNWASLFHDIHFALFLFPAGIFLCLRKLSEVSVLFVLYGMLSLIIGSVSSHFTAILFPAAAVLSSIGLISTFRTFMDNQDAPIKKKAISKEINLAVLVGIFALSMFFLINSLSATMQPSMYQTTTVFPAVSMATNEIRWVDDLREAAAWLRGNTEPDAKIVTWRGLSQQIASLSRRSVLGSDPTNPHNLSLVSKLFLAEEGPASEIARQLNASYVLILFGGASGYTKDDLTEASAVSLDPQFSQRSSLFKFCFHSFADYPTQPSSEETGFDLVRQQQVPVRPHLSHFEEMFTSEHWLIRIYALRDTPIVLPSEFEGVEGINNVDINSFDPEAAAFARESEIVH